MHVCVQYFLSQYFYPAAGGMVMKWGFVLPAACGMVMKWGFLLFFLERFGPKLPWLPPFTSNTLRSHLNHPNYLNHANHLNHHPTTTITLTMLIPQVQNPKDPTLGNQGPQPNDPGTKR